MSVFKKALEYLTGKQKEKELQEKNRQLEIENDKLFGLNKEKENLIEKLQNKQEVFCKNKILYNINTQSVTVVDCEGNSYSGITTSDVVEKLKTATTEEIIALLTPPKVEEKGSDFDIEKEESEIVKPFLSIFDSVDDFEVVGDKLFFRNIRSVEIPPLIVARFVELLEGIKHNVIQPNFEGEQLKEELKSLKAFTYWLLLNPIESARKDALNFIRKNQLPITSNGMLVTFRKVVSKVKTNKELVKFISESYFKVKKNKKSPKNYEIFDDNPLICVSGNKKHDYNNHVGNLYELYHNLSQFEENIFTDNHTKSKTIRIGEVYKEDEDVIDLDNTKNCSSGLMCSPSV